MISITFFTGLLILHNVESARVLLTVMDQGRPHVTSINTFMHRLQKDNPTTALEFAWFHPDIDFGMEERFIDMKGFENPFASPDFDKIAFEEDYSFIHQAVAYGFGSKTCNNILKHKKEWFNEIISEDWDLYLSDSLFAVCGYGMAEISGKPHVMMHSTDLASAQGSFKAFSG